MRLKDESVAVIGAGIVGTSIALELQRRGARVTLIDRSPPGRETSYGNAGMMARSSLVPFNNPGLWRALPGLLRNRSAQLRYDPLFVAQNARWAIGFLAHARRAAFDETTHALDGLIRLSTAEHRRLLHEAGICHRLRDDGWLFLYRDAAGHAKTQLARQTWERFGVATQALGREELMALEPSLKPIFEQAIWIKDAASVDDPGRVVEGYADLFVARGGTLERRDIVALECDGTEGWRLRTGSGETSTARQVVVALGPWAKEFLARLGLSVPLAFERGYHMHYGAQGAAQLGRSVYDTGGGYVLSPMERGLRLTTGVELAARDAPAKLAQLTLAEQRARQAFPLADRIDAEPWLGRRPTLPDSRPAIGPAPQRQGVWLAFGHQHIGFSTGPGTAALLGSMMAGDRPAIDAHPFRPERFVRAEKSRRHGG